LGAGSGYVVAKRTAAQAPPALKRAALLAPGVRTHLTYRRFTRWSEARLAEYRQRLDLSPAQESALRGHLDVLAADYDSLRSEVRSRMAESLWRANAAMARELTPEQRRLFWQHLRDRARNAGD
jgi:hypothetical protein